MGVLAFTSVPTIITVHCEAVQGDRCWARVDGDEDDVYHPSVRYRVKREYRWR